MTTVRGLITWAFLTKPDQYGKFSFNLLINEEEKDKLTKAIPSVKPPYAKDANTGLWQLKLGRKSVAMDGKKMQPIRLVDSQKTPINTILGNGSEVNVSLSEYNYTHQGKQGWKFNVNTVQLIKLVPYEKDGLSVVKDGYVATEKDKTPRVETPKETEGAVNGTPFNDSLDGLDPVTV